MYLSAIDHQALKLSGAWSVGVWKTGGLNQKSAFPQVKLNEIFSVRKEFIEPVEIQASNLVYLGLENIESNTGLLLRAASAGLLDIKSRSKIFRRGDILYGRLRPYLNKVYLSSFDEGICSNEFIVLIPKEDIITKHFARWILSSKYVLDYVREMQFGSSLPRLNEKDLLELRVPLPPLQEQQAIEQMLIESDRFILKTRSILNGIPAKTDIAIEGNLEEAKIIDFKVADFVLNQLKNL